ncbi:MAG: ATP-binding cassette domain-containing protein [Escherichia coli]|nr:ATP-binding cassette domain-containing protein [Escherichia coli]
MSIVMQLQDVAESTRLGPLSGEVRAGEILHLVGPNGAGKSTLLHQHDKTRTELLNDVAGALALDDKLGRSTNQLSGGEWQRVRLAAVVLQITPQANPAGQLLLLDEPMNSLDVAQQSALDKILSALCQQGLAIVMSSHDLNHTLRHAHRAWLLKGGKMLASGRREEVLTPPNLAQAYGMNFRRLDIEGHRMLISTI